MNLDVFKGKPFQAKGTPSSDPEGLPRQANNQAEAMGMQQCEQRGTVGDVLER